MCGYYFHWYWINSFWDFDWVFDILILLHIFVVMGSILTLDNLEEFKNRFNCKMKLLFGVNDWIKHSKYNLTDFIGKDIEEVEKVISHIDRDWEE